MYPTIAIEHNISFETVNCQCCANNTQSQVPSEVMDEINKSLLDLKKETRTRPYWICHSIKGAFPIKLQGLIYERDNYQTLLKEENNKSKDKRDSRKIFQYTARQMALKLLANAGYGVFARQDFDFSDYRVSELITGYGRLIHKQLQKIALEKYGLETIFGFTDSIFVKNGTLVTINEFIMECKNRFHVTLEHKSRFINTIVFDKKNRFIAWTGNHSDKPILKNLDGMSDRYPKWLKQNIEKIATHIITNSYTPEKHHNTIKSLIEQAFYELTAGKISHEDLVFVTKLSKEPEEYKNQNDRLKILARMIGAQKGDLVCWYDTFTEEYIKSKQCWRKRKHYSVKPENINLPTYLPKLHLHHLQTPLPKLKDSLEITGFNMDDLRLCLSRATTIAMNKCGGR
jgi:DNA polymerase elongation subunit (family B)